MLARFLGCLEQAASFEAVILTMGATVENTDALKHRACIRKVAKNTKMGFVPTTQPFKEHGGAAPEQDQRHWAEAQFSNKI